MKAAGFLLLVSVLLAACGGGVNKNLSALETSPQQGDSSAKDLFCQHLNGGLNDTLNLIEDAATTDGEALSALDSDAADFSRDAAQPEDSTVAGYASRIVAGIHSYEEAIRSYGLTAATDDHFSDTLGDAIPDVPAGYCS